MPARQRIRQRARARGGRTRRRGAPRGALRPGRRRRALGQHFLISGRVPERLVREFSPRPGEAVLEVGPGRGVLTRLLLDAGARVLAVELDAGLAAALRTDLSGETRLRVVQADILETDVRALLQEDFGHSAVRVLSSLPYSTGTAILERLCDAMPPVREAVVLLQHEVVARVVAGPGSPAYGYLSVAVGSRCAARAGFAVPPGAFSPPPRVLSRLLRLTPLCQPPVPAARRRAFLAFAGRLFMHPRKTLANNLRAAGYGEGALAAARRVGDPGARPGAWDVRRLAALQASIPEPAGAVLK